VCDSIVLLRYVEDAILGQLFISPVYLISLLVYLIDKILNLFYMMGEKRRRIN